MDKGLDLAIEVKNLKKSFGAKTEVLRGVDLNVPRGKITVIIGFSGAGKSVLLKHFMGLLKPDSGVLKVLGEEISHLNEFELNEIRKRFGMLFQSAALFDDMTTIENVEFPIQEYFSRIGAAKIREKASEKLKIVGLGPEHFHKYPSELSGGMRKRVGLARAIALEPEIILYDEPTTGLDPIITEMVDNLILDTQQHRPNLTSVIISHDLPAAFRIGDYIALLDAGRIKLFGTPQEFLDSNDPFIQKFVHKAKENGSHGK